MTLPEAVRPSVTLLGPVNVDILARPVDFSALSEGSLPAEDIRMSCGGNALNEAVILHRLGAQVDLVSAVGRDEAGEMLLRFLSSRGVSTSRIRRDAQLTTSINLVLVRPDGERFFLTNPRGSMRRLTDDTYLPHVDSAADLVCFPGMFVSPRTGIPEMERLFARIKSRPGRLLAADMSSPKAGETLRDLENILPHLDFFFPNEDQAIRLTGVRDVRECARMLNDAGVGCAVVKLGSRGALIRTASQLHEVPAYPVSRTVDTTGAGDSFAAGFLYARLMGYSLRDCALFGCATASCIVECLGASEGLRSREEVFRRFSILQASGS